MVDLAHHFLKIIQIISPNIDLILGLPTFSSIYHHADH